MVEHLRQSRLLQLQALVVSTFGRVDCCSCRHWLNDSTRREQRSSSERSSPRSKGIQAGLGKDGQPHRMAAVAQVSSLGGQGSTESVPHVTSARCSHRPLRLLLATVSSLPSPPPLLLAGPDVRQRLCEPHLRRVHRCEPAGGERGAQGDHLQELPGWHHQHHRLEHG